MVQSSAEAERKQAALDAVVSSELFAPLERLREFLAYIVAEEIAGRGNSIRGKTIAQDVYGRKPGAQGDPENVVRVDARRLRQTLDHYYETEGKNDPLRIRVATGGYCPNFEPISQPQPTAVSNGRSHILVAGLALVVGVGLGIGLASSWPISGNVSELSAGSEKRRTLERQAILDKSAASLQAVNLAEQAREMIYPIFDQQRQVLVTEIFRRVIALDPDYFGGYAGAAQTLATLAIFTAPTEGRDEILSEAHAMAREAVRLEPTDAWVQSARSLVEFASQNYDEALRYARRASELAPNDRFVSDSHGTVTLFAGEFAEAVDVVEGSGSSEANQRFANRNIFAAANYHLGNYEESIATFEAARSAGQPVSAPTFLFQAAALGALGRTYEAKSKLEELRTAWPDADLRAMLEKIYQHQEHVDQIFSPLESLDWQDTDGNVLGGEPTD